MGGSDGNFGGNTNNGSDDAFIVKLDSSGNTTWSGLVGGSKSDTARFVSSDNIGNIYNGRWLSWRF